MTDPSSTGSWMISGQNVICAHYFIIYNNQLNDYEDMGMRVSVSGFASQWLTEITSWREVHC